MKIVNPIIPFKGFVAMAIWPVIFIRLEYAGRYTAKYDNHEHIHLQQQKEMLLIFFYLWYGIEYLIRLIQYGGGNRKQAYRNISFEREAYANQGNANYLNERCFWSFMKYL